MVRLVIAKFLQLALVVTLLVGLSACQLGNLVKPGFDKCIDASLEEGTLTTPAVSLVGKGLVWKSVDSEKCPNMG